MSAQSKPPTYGTHIIVPASAEHIWQGVATGKPFAKARPRLTKRGFAYMPKSYREKQDNFRRQMAGAPTDPDILVWVEVISMRPIPKGVSTAGVRRIALTPTRKTPDVDNIAGGVLDAMFDDDAHVVGIFAVKVWSSTKQGLTIVNIYKAPLDSIEILC